MSEKRPIDIFAKRLDEIFEMGMPTKALIYDAFHKATETPISPEPPRQVSREEMIKRAIKHIDENYPNMNDGWVKKHAERLADFAIEQKGGSE